MRCFPTRVARTAMWRTPVRVGQAQNSRSRACMASMFSAAGTTMAVLAFAATIVIPNATTGLAPPSRSAEVAACSGGNGMVQQVVGGDLCPDKGSFTYPWPWIGRNRASRSDRQAGRLGVGNQVLGGSRLQVPPRKRFMRSSVGKLRAHRVRDTEKAMPLTVNAPDKLLSGLVGRGAFVIVMA